MLDILHPAARIYKKGPCFFGGILIFLNAIKPPAPSCRMGMPMGLGLLRRYLRGRSRAFSSLHPEWNSGTIFQKRRNAIMPFQLRPIFRRSFHTRTGKRTRRRLSPAPRDGY